MGGARVALAAAFVALAMLSLGATAAGEPPPDPAVLHYPRAIAEGPGGALWVADSVGILRIARGGESRRVLEQTGIESITRGPDDAVWFTQYSPPSIGRITDDGHVESFSAGISAAPNSIATGHDGNLWFTEQARIGRITPAGAGTEFSAGLPRQRSLVGLAPGPGGKVWFTDFLGAVGRVTPSGAIKEFPVRSFSYEGPEKITAGRDGALWFTESDSVGRITTAGRVRFFKVPLASLTGIARGQGGVWVSGSCYGTLDCPTMARVTPRGGVKGFGRGLSGIDTTAITRARDGTVWVSEDARRMDVPDPIARLRSGGRPAREIPPPPRCRVPKVQRYSLAWVESEMFSAYCAITRASRRAGRSSSKIALGTRPGAGASLPFDTRVKVRFAPAPPLPKRCRLPFGGRRLASTPAVLVYSYTDYSTEYPESKTHYGACLRPHGRLHQITTAEDLLDYYEEASRFRAAGSFTAFAYYTADHYNNSSISLNVYDVRSRRFVFGRTVEQHDSGGSPDDFVLVDYALSPHGAIAWVVGSPRTYELYAHGPTTRTRELDAGTSLTNLEFSGDTLSWTSASGERKSADVR